MPLYNMEDLIEKKPTNIPANSVPIFDGCERTVAVIPAGSACEDLVPCVTTDVVLWVVNDSPSIKKTVDGFEVDPTWMNNNIISDWTYPNLTIWNSVYNVWEETLAELKIYLLDWSNIQTVNHQESIFFQGLSGLIMSTNTVPNPENPSWPAIPSVLIDLPLQNRFEWWVLTRNAITNRSEWRESTGWTGWSIDCNSVMLCPWIQQIQSDVTALEGESWTVKVGWAVATAKYLATDVFDDTGATTTIKTQMSITSDASGLKLENDESSPWPGYKYGTDGAWNKWRFPDVGASQTITPVSLQNTVTVTHNLSKYPNVICLDPAGRKIVPEEVTHTSNMSYTVTFSPVFSGSVVTS